MRSDTCNDLFVIINFLVGCPIQQLWKHLEERKPPFPLKLDSAAKEFIWKAIVDMPGVEFFVLDKPLPHVFGAKCNDADEMQLMQSTNPVGQVLFVFFHFLGKEFAWNL